MTILLTGSDSSPWILMLLMSGGVIGALADAPALDLGAGSCGLGPPQPASRTAMEANAEHTRIRMSKH